MATLLLWSGFKLSCRCALIVVKNLLSTIRDSIIHTLLYADDLVLIARNKGDLQSQLNALYDFITSVKMEVNMDKTKIMILRNNKRKSRSKLKNHPIWYLGGKPVKECESYKYLGVTLKSNGTFVEHVEKIKEKAQKSYFALLAKSKEWGGISTKNVFVFI